MWLFTQEFPDLPVEGFHDFELTHTRRPKILVQTAGHVAGAVYYYQKRDVENEEWKPDKVCLLWTTQCQSYMQEQGEFIRCFPILDVHKTTLSPKTKKGYIPPLISRDVKMLFFFFGRIFWPCRFRSFFLISENIWRLFTSKIWWMVCPKRSFHL